MGIMTFVIWSRITPVLLLPSSVSFVHHYLGLCLRLFLFNFHDFFSFLAGKLNFKGFQPWLGTSNLNGLLIVIQKSAIAGILCPLVPKFNSTSEF